MNRTLLQLIEAEFVRYKLLGERAMGQLRPDELHVRGEHGNSVAIIVWHVSGNLESKFTDLLTSDGEKPWRNRDSEFELRDVSRAEVADKWERGWGVLFGALTELTDDDLAAPITIRGVPFRVDEALLRSLAHLAYHVGQISCWRRPSAGTSGSTSAFRRASPRRTTGTRCWRSRRCTPRTWRSRRETEGRLILRGRDGARTGTQESFSRRWPTASGPADPVCRPRSPRRTPSSPRQDPRWRFRGQT